jgi:hypothetical protein
MLSLVDGEEVDRCLNYWRRDVRKLRRDDRSGWRRRADAPCGPDAFYPISCPAPAAVVCEPCAAASFSAAGDARCAPGDGSRGGSCVCSAWSPREGHAAAVSYWQPDNPALFVSGGIGERQEKFCGATAETIPAGCAARYADCSAAENMGFPSTVETANWICLLQSHQLIQLKREFKYAIEIVLKEPLKR